MEAARTHINNKHWREAIKALEMAEAVGKPDPSLRPQLIPLAKQVADEGNKQLEDCRKLISENKYEEAIKGLKFLLTDFRPLKCSIEARNELAKLKENPEVQKFLKEMEAQDLDDNIEAILDRALEKDSSQSTGENSPTSQPDVVKLPRLERIKKVPLESQEKIFDLLQKIAGTYPDFDSGKRAQQDLDALRADSKFMSSLEKYRTNRMAFALLKVAESYITAGMDDKACEKLQSIIKDYPESDACEKAKELLAKLK